MVSVNDTIRKLTKNGTYTRKQFDRLYSNKNYIVQTDPQQRFSIKAKKSDSLYFTSRNHIAKAYLVNDLLKPGDIKIELDPIPCDTVKCREKPKLYAVIAQKTSLKRQPSETCPGTVILDSKFEAEYKILESVYGGYTSETIKFTVWDHYGTPAFADYPTVLLLIGDHCGKLVHVKYQFANLYKTSDGRWATPYQAWDYEKSGNTSIQPEIIDFANPVEFDLSDASDEWISNMYPEPYYSIRDGKAIAIYGNYVSDILELKKQLIFRNYKIFDEP